MKEWHPISKTELLAEISKGENSMESQVLRFWEQIQIPLAKWQELKMGKEGNGFWAVGVLGKEVIWYNDIEDGFNISPYESWGVIKDYRCNQDDLNQSIQKLFRFLVSGQEYLHLGPPERLY